MDKGVNQIRKRLLRQLVLTNGVSQSDEHRMLRLTGIHPVEFSLPPGEQPETFFLIADLIAKIVCPAAEGIHIVKVLVKLLWKKEADDVEVFIMRGRQPARV